MLEEKYLYTEDWVSHRYNCDKKFFSYKIHMNRVIIVNDLSRLDLVL